ncbi:MAG TPA: hypothetical protein PLC52_00020 [Anaerolineales bacterium]|nr:hypothetical protein [Anaerolineales bacterium]HRQ91239.1 hypothetical protein [Anaerolineales bacterium]
MPRIRCHYVDCVFLDEGYCAAAAVELDSDEGCLTYAAAGEVSAEDAWDDNEALEEEWEEAGFAPDEDEDEDGDDDLEEEDEEDLDDE